MNIAVYCGALSGNDPDFVIRAKELGEWMARNGHRLIYGGGNAGMMGSVSNALLDCGGEATGVAPAFFILAEETRTDAIDLEIAESMSTRRVRMMELADAFIALPGGTGTLDEISEVMAMKRLGLLGEFNKPVMLYNVNGYYDHFFEFLDDMAAHDFCRAEDRNNAIEVSCIEDIEQALEEAGSIDKTRNSKYDK